MKTLLLIVFLMSGTCYGQTRGDNLVVVHVTDTTGMFEQIIRLLIVEGYPIEKESAKYGYINTGFKTWDYHSLSIRVVMGSDRVFFRGMMKATAASAMGMGDADIRAEYMTGKWKVQRAGFDELMRVGFLLNPLYLQFVKE